MIRVPHLRRLPGCCREDTTVWSAAPCAEWESHLIEDVIEDGRPAGEPSAANPGNAQEDRRTSRHMPTDWRPLCRGAGYRVGEGNHLTSH